MPTSTEPAPGDIWRARAARVGKLVRAAAHALARGLRALRPRGALILFCALLIADVTYRLVLIYHLSFDAITPFSFVPLFHNEAAVIRCFLFDWWFITVLCAALGCCELAIVRLAPPRLLRALRPLGWTIASTVALAAGVDAGAHLRTLLSMHAGVDAGLLEEALAAGAIRDLLGYAHGQDLLLASLPLLLLCVIARSFTRFERFWSRLGLGLSLACVLAYVPAVVNAHLQRPTPQLNAALRWAPLYYTGYFVWQRFTQGRGRFARMAEGLPEIERHGLFVNGTPPETPAPSSAARERYNVLLIIMESTGAQYAFDTHRRNPTPMPRLRALMNQSLELARHYTTSNTSPRALFSLFTGLYPQPTPAMFVTRPDIRIPGIASALGPAYDRFFVTPGRLQFYMPHAMLENDGLREMYGYENLPVPNPKPTPDWVGLDEIQTVDFFLKRMGAAKEPFFATYYSFAPHYDYYDHGEAFRIFHDLEDPMNRYYNNLRLLDVQIGRMLDLLTSQRRLERTVVIALGDHGEGFGQHPNDFTHSRHSFEENLRTPAVFYQPRLFNPGRIEAPTSHVDILPTLLDALGVPYDGSKMQGMSVLRGPPLRKYIYVWGNEGTLSSLEGRYRKLQVSFEHDRCWRYDLRLDSRERNRQKCDDSVQPQLDNLLRFWNFQRRALADYNNSVRRH
jgi:hypothetical protein